MKPYDKAPLRKLISSAEAELEKLKQEKNSYRNMETGKLTPWCASLEKWVKNYPLAKGASYQKSIQGILAKIKPKQAYYASSMSAADYTKVVQQFRTLAQKINHENRNVFIVHGHDHVTRNEVQQTLHSLSIPSIVLDKEGDAGQTITDKFEKAAAQCEYAVVICSPDDEGRLKPKTRKISLEGLRARARQNVVFELGYFVALLTRKNIFQLYTADLETPSDMHGVIFQNGNSNWKIKLVRELRTAGFVIDQQAADRL